MLPISEHGLEKYPEIFANNIFLVLIDKYLLYACDPQIWSDILHTRNLKTVLLFIAGS